HFQRKYGHIADNYALSAFVEDFVKRSVSGDWGSWGENVGSWVGTRLGSPQFLLIRYEDLASQAHVELERLSQFLGISPDPALFTRTIEQSSAEQMKEMEKKQGGQWVSTKGKRSDIPFVRSASSGGWRNTLAPESAAAIESAWGELMTRL